MIKGRIEALIEREFLERDEVNMKLYKYLVFPPPIKSDCLGIKRLSKISNVAYGNSIQSTLPYIDFV
jgi:hypothetical protein